MVYEALDFYDIDSQLTEEELMVRDMVRDWVEEEVLPKIEEACSEGAVSYTHLTLPTILLV